MPSTPREMRLRARIDELTDERDRALDNARVRQQRAGGRRMRNCVYCGVLSRGIACHMHADLPNVDPYYQA